MIRLAGYLVVIACALVGCSDRDPLPIATNPAPVVFRDTLGGWTGYLIISDGSNSSYLCTETWVITSQTDGGTAAVPTRWFSGTFQRSGSAVTCASSGTLTGIITHNGTAFLVHSTSVGVDVGCTLASTTMLGGIYNEVTLTAQSTETINCGGTLTQRTLTLAMHQ